ncbi:MAG: flagellar hook-length control protein FliK [Lachnospiraceae bacterium]|nr:flagellar hook-length control protein FliK [Lachnospiraceae bacterium]
MIQHYLQSGRVQGTQQVTQTQPTAAEAALARGQERLAATSDGQTIQGKVLLISEGKGGERTAQVDLGGGAVINARVTGNMSLAVGQDISFSVKNADPANVTLRPLYANTAADTSVMKALTQAGLSSAGEMPVMVREMMNEGLAIDRSSLLNMSRGVSSFPGHAVSIVQMTNLGIPVNEANIEQFENYKNFEHQVMNSIDSIMDDLPDAFREMQGAGNNRGALDLYGELLGLFSEKGQEGEAAAQIPNGTTRVITEDALLGDGKTIDAGKAAAETGETVQAGDHDAAQTAAVRSEGRMAAADTDIAEHIGRSNAQAGESTASSDAGSVLEAAMKALREAGTSPAAQTPQTHSSAQFPELLRSLGVPEQIVQNLNSGEAMGTAQTDLMRVLADAWQKTGHKDAKTDEVWTNLFSSKEMNGIIKNAIAKDWLLSPDDVANKENVKGLYERLQNQTAKLSQALSDAHGLGTHLSENVKNLQQNIDFMNDLNHMFQYVQLPLKMNGRNTHGDLYVYQNKKNAMHEDGTVSAILHLDMEHMGPVDVYVKMRDNNVKTNFYLADDEMIDFLMDHIDILNSRLEKRGYTMEAKMHLQDEEMTEDAPVKEMLAGNIGSMSMLSHTSFDALA